MPPTPQSTRLQASATATARLNSFLESVKRVEQVVSEQRAHPSARPQPSGSTSTQKQT